MPDYIRKSPELFDASRKMALFGFEPIRPVLVTNDYVDSHADALTAHLKAQHSAEWLFYQPQSSEEHLSPFEFRTAMAIRCRTLPREIRERVQTYRCNCGKSQMTVESCVDHILQCGAASHFTFTHRHTDVKYAIARVMREFGVPVTVEPTFYNYRDAARRPDLTAQARPPAAIDIVISTQQGEVGDHAAEWARKKRQIHDTAVKAQNHVFFPFALETHGHLHSDAVEFIDHVKKDLADHLKPQFRRRLLRAVSASLAKSRVRTVTHMPQIWGTSLS